MTASTLTVNLIWILSFPALRTYVDESEVVFVCREEVRPDVLLQLRSVSSLQNEIKHCLQLRGDGGNLDRKPSCL